jgi:DNA mismatch repair protein MutS2
VTAADDGALVLLDEVGAGTDPDEGAALGIAILEILAAQGTSTVATTHLEAIKAFAATHEGVTNGSVEFDLDTLRPLYRLNIGLPGRSFAVEIAARLGLPEVVVQRARQILGEGRQHLRGYVERLQQVAEELDAARRTAAEETDLARRARDRWERESQSLAEEAARYRREAQQAIREILAEGRRRIGAVVDQVRERAGAAVAGTIPSASRSAEAIRAGLPSLPEPPAHAVANSPEVFAPPKDLSPGCRVLVRDVGQQGTVLESPSPDGRVLVQVGVGKLRVPTSALAALPGSVGGSAGRAAPPPPVVARPDAPAIGPETNVLGCTVDDARARVERYLDDAYLSGLTRVRIVHGKGTGALRKGLADLLKAHPLVESFVLADQAEGGSGATVVTLHGQGPSA